MRKPKLLEYYTFLLVDAVSPFAHSVIRQTTVSPFIPGGADLVKDIVKPLAMLDANIAATDHPSPAQTAQRDLLRADVIAELGRLAKRLNLDFPGDEPALLSSGLTLGSQAGTAARALASDAPVMEFELLDGLQSGCLLLKLARPHGTTQNLIRYTTDPKLPEEHWLVAVGGGRERQLGPFEPGTRVYVKAAALTNSTTEPVYAASKSRLVQ